MRRLFSTLIFATAVLLFAAFAWLGAQGTSWAWAAVALSILYTAGALLYRWESRLPRWMAQVIQVAATFWPPIKWLKTSDEVYAANKALVNDFNLTLAEYQLKPLEKERGEELAERARLLKVRTLAEAWTEQKAPNTPSGDGTARPGVDALELFCRERSGKVTVNLWQAQKGDLVHELAPLIRHNWRVSASDQYPFSDADVYTLLDSLRDFDIDLIAKELRAVSQLGGRLRRYAEFLRTGREESTRVVGDITSLVEEHGGESSTNTSALFGIESPAEILKLMEALEGCDDRALGAVHRGIFLAERDFDVGALKELACAVVAQWPANSNTDPILVLQAYLWEKDQRDGEAVTPDELDSNWRKWSDNAKRALESKAAGSFDVDRNRLAYRLEAGTWPTRRGAHSDNPYPPPPPITASGHEEIRDLDAYLITFDERSGSIAKVVDGLRQAPDQRSIYRFGPYTRHTRLGIVPRGMPFHEFVERFFADLDDALRNYHPEPNGHPTSNYSALRFVAGQPHTIVLKHDHKCKGPVKFAIAEPPTTGRLGEVESWAERDSRHALVRYFPESVTKAKRTSFAYTSNCADRQESHTIHLLVESKGQKGQLDQIEVTVNRIDLAHCRELWFGDPALGPVMRSPSIYDVLTMIESELDGDERPSVEAAFERVAGGQHRP